MRQTLSIVVSAYDEEENIKELYRQLKDVIQTLPLSSVEIIFVDDGSKDGTFQSCKELQNKDPSVKIVRLIRNFGHEIAMRAGMDHAKGDAVVFMDADLQHPPSHIKSMVDLWQKGHDAVLTRRTGNTSTTAFYRLCTRSFYGILNFFSDVKIPGNTPDFRLLDHRYVSYLEQFEERDFLFRGILNWMTAGTEHPVVIDFNAPPRFAGTTKYNFARAFKLAISSILQFSVKPLYFFPILFALISAAAAIFFGVYAALSTPSPAYLAEAVPVILLFSGSGLFFILAVFGIYIAKIHVELKKRPLYLAEFIEKNE